MLGRIAKDKVLQGTILMLRENNAITSDTKKVMDSFAHLLLIPSV